jgi:signal transduction histidine kinase
MNTFIQQVFEILTTAPGNLIYHLILIFSITAAMQVVIVIQGPRTARNRIILGLGVMLIGQAILFICSGLVWQGVINSRAFLPPLDRILTAFSLVWVIWMWVFPNPQRTPDVVHTVLNLVMVLLALFTITAWGSQNAQVPYNLSIYDISWNALIILITLIGIVALMLAHPAGWGVGLAMMLLPMAGSVFHLLWTLPEGDFAPALRIASIAAFPMLPTLVMALKPAGQTASQADSPAPARSNGFVERRRYNAEPRAVYAWLQVAAEDQPVKIYPALTHAIGQSMLADLCLFVTPSFTSRDMVLHTGWDLIRDETIQAGNILEQQKLPAIANAFQRGRSITIDHSSPSTQDLTSLSQILGLQKIHSLLFVPINSPKKVLGGFILLSIYSERNWSAEDQSYLLTGMESIAQLMVRIESGASIESEEASLKDEIRNLKIQLEQAQTEIAARESSDINPSQSTQLQDLLAVYNESESLIGELKQENQNLQTQILQLHATATVNLDERSIQQIAELKDHLSIAQARILELESELAKQSTGGFVELKKFSQIFTSIIGYTDLLLSETTGALSSLQRNFLERVRTSTAQMKEMLESQSHDRSKLAFSAVDVTNLIDEAVMEMRPDLREKDLNLRVDIPSELPAIQTDPSALQQVMVSLLKNAVLISPQEGNINLLVRADIQDDHQTLLIQVTDFGGGIAPRELPRVFNRPFNGEPTEIEGLGDSGTNLAVAKTLVEANGGRIWVESHPQLSTTFSVLIPFSQPLESQSTMMAEEL